MRILDPQSLSRHVDRLYRAAWALCGSREDAEDLVQETFARVLARPRVLHGDAELYYLMRVLRNTFLTSRRTASRRPVTVATLEDVVAEDARPMGRPDRALEVREVYAAIANLPEEFRMAIVAIDVLGLSYRDAARALKVKEATITSRLFRARKRVAADVLAPQGAGEVARAGDAPPAVHEPAPHQPAPLLEADPGAPQADRPGSARAAPQPLARAESHTAPREQIGPGGVIRRDAL